MKRRAINDVFPVLGYKGSGNYFWEPPVVDYIWHSFIHAHVYFFLLTPSWQKRRAINFCLRSCVLSYFDAKAAVFQPANEVWQKSCCCIHVWLLRKSQWTNWRFHTFGQKFCCSTLKKSELRPSFPLPFGDLKVFRYTRSRNEFILIHAKRNLTCVNNVGESKPHVAVEFSQENSTRTPIHVILFNNHWRS